MLIEKNNLMMDGRSLDCISAGGNGQNKVETKDQYTMNLSENEYFLDTISPYHKQYPKKEDWKLTKDEEKYLKLLFSTPNLKIKSYEDTNYIEVGKQLFIINYLKSKNNSNNGIKINLSFNELNEYAPTFEQKYKYFEKRQKANQKNGFENGGLIELIAQNRYEIEYGSSNGTKFLGMIANSEPLRKHLDKLYLEN